MGAGIAQLAIEAGLDTIALEVDVGRAEAARERITHFLGRKVEKGQLEAAARDDALAEQLGRRPVRCADTPGFVVNRVLIPLLNDCVRVLDEAGVSPEDLDTAMTLGAGWPLGPCALLDLVGIDVHVHASETLYGAL